MTDKLEIVLDLAARGLRVFPIMPNAKTPAFAGWQDAATSDPQILTDWFTGQFKDCNPGVATGRGVMVVDADAKNGGLGLQSLDLLGMDCADLDFTVDTPSGGRHAYFFLPPDTRVANSVRSISGYPDIDIRGDGGYVVGPGATIDGRPYAIVNANTIPHAAPALVDLVLKAKRVRDKATSTAVAELDTVVAVNRAVFYLANNAPLAVQGASGDDTTYRVAAHIKDYGLSAESVLDLLIEHWNERCSPPWEYADLEGKVASAFASGTSPPGSKTAAAEFDAIDLEAIEQSRTKHHRGLYSVPFEVAASQALANFNPALIDDIMGQRSFAVVYGPSNSGKTFLALSMSYHVAMNLPWAGHDVSQGQVLYVVAEGGHGINKRLAALQHHYKPQSPVPLDIIPCPVDLRSDDADVKRIVKVATALAAENHLPLKLIVVDTLSRALAGGDENASTDMGAFIANIDKLRQATDATVLVVHHTGKNVANGARGWSGLRAAIDTEIEVTEGNNIEFAKQRDLEKIPGLSFRLEIITLGATSKGRPISSCVLHAGVAAEGEFDAQMEIPALAKDYFDCLDGEMSIADWNKAFDEFMAADHQPRLGEKSLQRLRSTLIDGGWVERVSKTHCKPAKN